MVVTREEVAALLRGRADHSEVVDKLKAEMGRAADYALSPIRRFDITLRKKHGALRLLRATLVTHPVVCAKEPLGPHLLDVIDLSVRCAKEGVSSSELPFVALQVWTALEARKEALSDEFFIPASGHPPSKLSLLSLANTLLRRLSRGQNAEFCGRVVLLMTALLPLAERSGLNLAAASNAANVTEWDDEAEAKAILEGATQDGDDEDEDEDEDGDGDADRSGRAAAAAADVGAADAPAPPTAQGQAGGALAIDYALYRDFWQLQHDMRDAQKAVKDASRLPGFVARCGVVLAALESVPVGPATAVADGEFFAAKYLTTSRLLRLQLRDPQLRRHVLVQILITLAFLRRAGAEGNREQTEALRKRCIALLRAVRPHGQAFTQAITQLLSREAFWADWKKNKCPAFALQRGQGSEASRPDALKVAAAAKDAALTESKPLRQTAALFMVRDLNTVVEKGDRQFVPEFGELAGRMEDALDPEMAQFAEEIGDNPREDSLYCWRGLRLTARTRLEHLRPHFEDVVRACSRNPAVRHAPATAPQERSEDAEGVPAAKRARRAAGNVAQ